MINVPGSERRFFFSDPKLEVLSFWGTEGISQLYAFGIELVSTSTEIDFDKLVGKPASLTIAGLEQHKRHVSGIITRFEIVGAHQPNVDAGTAGKKRTIYRAQLEPVQARLMLRRRLRVFQDLTTRQIVSQVLAEGGVTAVEWRLKESYKPRNTCVQYRETDMELIARLLEEEGIAYHFEHGESEAKMVLSDHAAAFTAVPGASQLVYNPIVAVVPGEYVRHFEYGEQLCSGRVQLRDYNFKKPRAPVEGEAEGREKELEVYDYPGEFVEDELGKRLARVRLEQLEGEHQVGRGSGNCTRMAAGSRFTLGGKEEGRRYPRGDLNQEYLLTQVVHRGSQPNVMEGEGGSGATSYTNEFVVIPARVTFRPARLTARPTALGTHTATVVGPPGEQIYVDSYGRVKVRFHWEREQKNTSWVRVAQSWAGAGFGSVMLPRVGQEVLVGFLEGDPDRPVVTGWVYNGEQVLPYDLPGQKTRSTVKSNSSPAGSAGVQEASTPLVSQRYANEGSNELRFEDKQGQEEVYVHAQRDYNEVVERDRSELVKHDERSTVQNNWTLEVTKASVHTSKTTLIQATKKITLKVGDSTIVMTPSKIAITGASISGTSGGVVDIKGGLVKINNGGG